MTSTIWPNVILQRKLCGERSSESWVTSDSVKLTSMPRLAAAQYQTWLESTDAWVNWLCVTTRFCGGLRITAPDWQGRPTWSNAGRANRRSAQGIDHGEPTADHCQPQKRHQKHRT